MVLLKPFFPPLLYNIEITATFIFFFLKKKKKETLGELKKKRLVSYSITGSDSTI